MTDIKRIWSPIEVEEYLAVRKKNGTKLVLPQGAYVTENFSWNEVLQTNSKYMDLPTRQVLRLTAVMCLLGSFVRQVFPTYEWD